jgi:hypothetical protein
MRFCTSVHCMDGRVQLPVIGYLTARFGVDYVDVVTEPGPNRILARHEDAVMCESILRRVGLSLQRHNSVGIAIAGHYGCASNPGGQREQAADILTAVKHLQQCFPQLPVIGLWVNERWEVIEVSEAMIGLLSA